MGVLDVLHFGVHYEADVLLDVDGVDPDPGRRADALVLVVSLRHAAHNTEHRAVRASTVLPLCVNVNRGVEVLVLIQV